MAITAGTHLGRYEIRSQLGAGGMGEVYLAQDTQLDRTIALKVLPAEVAYDQQRMRRFVQEAKAAAALSHPNIAHIYEIGNTDGTSFIAMEYVNGETLRHHMAREKMKLNDVLDVAIQAASALAAAHAAGIIHRDIKPENIMLSRDGIVKVLDFGLAKITEPQSSDPEAATVPMLKTDTGVVMGTTRYMSPEQTRGLALDARTDIWSLGVVLYEMVTGRTPFGGLTNSDVIVSILGKEPPQLTHYSLQAPVDLQRIVKKALRKDREERYQTINDLLIDLKSLRRELDVTGERKHTALPKISRTAAGAALGILVIAIGILFYARSNRKAIDSVAVLPLANASADPNTEYLSDGITESLINSLSQLPNLRVIARSSVFRYKGGEIDPQKVGHELGVQALLTGRVVQRDDTLLISVEMMDVRDSRHLWGEKYQRKLSDLLAMQEEIAQEISEKLRLRLTGEEESRVTKHYTRDTEAHQLYLKGRYYLNKRTPDDLKRAADLFQQAIDKDPNYALAYAGLADTYNVFTTFRVLPPKEAYPKAKAAATKALEIDDTLADAHTALAEALAIYDWDWPYAEQEFKRAIELNPNYASAHYFYGLYHLTPTGRMSEAITEMKHARELDPLSPTVNANFGWIYFLARQYDQTVEQERKTFEIDPNSGHVHAQMGEAYAMKGMYEQAIAELQKANDLTAGTIGMGLGHAYAVSGKRDEARKEIDKLKEQSKHSYVPPYWIALIYAGLGEKDEAFRWLEKEYEDQDWLLCFIKVDPRWDSLRPDPRFVDLLGRLGLSP